MPPAPTAEAVGGLPAEKGKKRHILIPPPPTVLQHAARIGEDHGLACLWERLCAPRATELPCGRFGHAPLHLKKDDLRV